jgi:hypothetical protein
MVKVARHLDLLGSAMEERDALLPTGGFDQIAFLFNGRFQRFESHPSMTDMGALPPDRFTRALRNGLSCSIVTEMVCRLWAQIGGRDLLATRANHQ